MQKTLLIADDAVVIRQVIRDAAGQAGWSVLGEAANGCEAARQHAALRPDVTICDLAMPECDGLHALREIRRQDPTARLVMLCTANQRELLKQSFQLGAADFVVKPFHREQLIEALEKALTAE